MCDENYGDARERVEKNQMFQTHQQDVIDALVAALEDSVRLMEAMRQSVHRPTLNKVRAALALACKGGRAGWNQTKAAHSR